MKAFWKTVVSTMVTTTVFLVLCSSVLCSGQPTALTRIEVRKTKQLTTDSISYDAFWINDTTIAFIRAGARQDTPRVYRPGTYVRHGAWKNFAEDQEICLMNTNTLKTQDFWYLGWQTLFCSFIPTADHSGTRVFVFQGAADTPDQDRVLFVDVQKRIRGEYRLSWERGTFGRFSPYLGFVSPDGKRLAMDLHWYELGRGLGVYTGSTGEFQRMLLPDDRTGAEAIAWSVDSKKLAFVSYTDTSSCDSIQMSGRPEYIVIADLELGKLVELPYPYDSYSSISWSPRGDEIVVHGAEVQIVGDRRSFDYDVIYTREQLWKISVDTHKRTPLIDWGGAECTWSPDGEMIAFENKDAVWVMDENGVGNGREWG
ncbi:hypothetical protein AMJ40_06445 [candidate division TA06 bacterium DG_26]|uniref:Dipeptidylpeptidase IV N-terminal domain-containing protein n=1 Tax=candidate division TA06 bacterium DG_26 TaxID=1703771 RepID=A0A0S7WFV9_UNCT6|nr:MAG: hypothetical protein AMJ40_06445 [candidate division TA06 bacterium DG_26]